MEEPKPIRAKKIETISITETKDGPKFQLNYGDESSKGASVEISKSLASRIKSQKLSRDFKHNFNIYLDENGVGVDIDKEPKTTNLPIESNIEGSDLKPTVILEVLRNKHVNIKQNVGNVDTSIVQEIKRAASDHIEEYGEIKAYDILKGDYFVEDVRQGGRLVYVTLT